MQKNVKQFIIIKHFQLYYSLNNNNNKYYVIIIIIIVKFILYEEFFFQFLFIITEFPVIIETFL